MTDAFRARFGGAQVPRFWRAPGRVNLIGEHTDYNLGFVLPIALDLACYVASAPSEDGMLRICSEHHDEVREWRVEQVRELRPQRHWTDYPIGVAQELLRSGFGIRPLNLLVRSTVPEGSGLSSSAALEVSSALAMLDGRDLDRLEMARLCQRAEVSFVGMPCGIMDQYISTFGRKNAAVRIDCRSLEHEIVTLPAGAEFLAVNTMVKHELSTSAYKERTQQCAAAVEMIRQRHRQVASLRDVTPGMLEPLAAELPHVIYRRARHVVTEDARVEEFVSAAGQGDLKRMGDLFLASHRSLQHDYEVSSPELDLLVETAMGIQGVYGARMTGGGFGGCIVAMMQPGTVPRFRTEIVGEYHARFGIQPAIYPCHPSDGAAEVKNIERIPGPAN